MKMRWVAVGLVWVGVCEGLAVGQSAAKADSSAALRNDKQKRPMTFADLMAMKRVSDPQISASGKWVMFSVMDVSLEKNTKGNHLWVVALGGGGGTEADSSAALRNDKQSALRNDKQSALRNDKQSALRNDKQSALRNDKQGGLRNDKQGGLRNDKQEERQVTFGDGESNGRFSPDGKWVLYTSDMGGGSQLWLAPWDEAKGELGSPRSALTAVSTEADGGIWSPDSKRVMFVSSVYPECSVKGGEASEDKQQQGKKQISYGNDKQKGNDRLIGTEAATWAEEEACDKAKDEAAAKSPVKAQVWDSLLYRHWDKYTGVKRSHVLVVDLNARLSGTPGLGENVRDLTPASVVGDAETPTFSLGGPLGYAWAPDSKEIAYVTNLDKVPAASTNNDVFTLRLDEAGAKAVKVSTSPGSDDGPAYSPDGRWLAFRSQARNGFESDRFRLVMFDRQAKTIKEMLRVAVPARPGMPGAPAFGLWVDEFTWLPNSKIIYFVSGEKGEAPVFRINLEGDDFHRLGRIHGEWSSIAINPTDYSIVGSLMKVDHPSEIVVGLQSEMDDTEQSFNIALDGSAPTVDTTKQEYQARQLTH